MLKHSNYLIFVRLLRNNVAASLQFFLRKASFQTTYTTEGFNQLATPQLFFDRTSTFSNLYSLPSQKVGVTTSSEKVQF